MQAHVSGHCQQWAHTHSYKPMTMATHQDPFPKHPWHYRYEAAAVQCTPSNVFSFLERRSRKYFSQKTDSRKTRKHACGEKLSPKHSNFLPKGRPKATLGLYQSQHKSTQNSQGSKGSTKLSQHSRSSCGSEGHCRSETSSIFFSEPSLKFEKLKSYFGKITSSPVVANLVNAYKLGLL